MFHIVALYGHIVLKFRVRLLILALPFACLTLTRFRIDAGEFDALAVKCHL